MKDYITMMHELFHWMEKEKECVGHATSSTKFYIS